MYIKVRAKPESKKEKINKISEDHFEVLVKERAERNKANTRIIELIACYFSVPINSVRIINGHRSHSKLLVVEKD